MAYVTAEARQELLDAVAEAIDELATAIAAMGDAYEMLDEQGADRLESELFKPMQTAYGRAKRTYTDFAGRHGLRTRDFRAADPGAVAHQVREVIERAAEAVTEADELIITLQDSLKPVEVGDPELRAGLSEIRRLIGDLPARSERFVNLVGR